MNKILLVGGAGYIGSVLANELLERGYAITILDRLYYGEDGLSGIRDRVELVVSDMRCVGREILEGVDAVVNLGGLSNDPTAEYNPKANFEMNTKATCTLAEMCRDSGVRRYLFASSASIYDRGVGNGDKDVVQTEQSEVTPRAAYSKSKYDAERLLLGMVGDDFCPTILRKGTVYGFSPRMRYDLVVNTFVKDALSKGVITIHYGGEMWRPMVEVRDVAQAYIAVLEANETKVKGEIFNVSYQNFRISELALRVREAMCQLGYKVDVRPDYGYKGVRSYRVNSDKIERGLGVKPKISVEESVADLVEKITRHRCDDFENPQYYNIRWMKFLEQADVVIRVTGSVFDAPARAERPIAVGMPTLSNH